MRGTLKSGVTILVLGGAMLAGTLLASATSLQVGGRSALASAQTTLPVAQAIQLQDEITQLRHQLTGAEPQLRLYDNDCVYLPEDASVNPATGPTDPRLQSCPNGRDHPGPSWSSQPTAVQVAIYQREILLFPLNITIAQAQSQMQMALTPLP